MNRNKQRGSLLITALVIAVVLLALGLALVRILQGSAHTNAVEYLGTRAFFGSTKWCRASFKSTFSA